MRAAARAAAATAVGAGGAAAVTLTLCSRERHGPAGSKSRVSSFVDDPPPWFIRGGVAICVTLVDQAVRALLALNSLSLPGWDRSGSSSSGDGSDGGGGGGGGGGSFSISTEGDYDLGELLRSYRLERRPLIIASNHATYLDAPLLATRIGRAAAAENPTPFGFLWTLDSQCWPFCVASASLLFNEGPARATFISLLCGLPVQPKWKCLGEPHPEELFRLNNSQYLPDIISVVSGKAKGGSGSGSSGSGGGGSGDEAAPRMLLIFPEGRLLQEAVEPRDDQGRWTQLDGKKSEPGAMVGTFQSGLGRIVAHCSSGMVRRLFAHPRHSCRSKTSVSYAS